MPGSFRVTHPFHPLCGREFPLVCRRPIFGRCHVYLHDVRGRLQAIPVEWTDLAGPDVFVEVSAGRSAFRPDDLLRLADLVESLRREIGAARPSGRAEGV